MKISSTALRYGLAALFLMKVGAAEADTDAPDISQQCKDAVIKYGVLMKDGKPAGLALLNKPVLKVAIVEGDPETFKVLEGTIPEKDKRGLSSVLLRKATYAVSFDNDAVKIPPREDLEEIFKKAFSYRYEGNVVFVSPAEAPDIFFQPYIDASGDIISGGFSSIPPLDFDHRELEAFREIGLQYDYAVAGGDYAAVVGVNAISWQLGHQLIKNVVEKPSEADPAAITKAFYTETLIHELGHGAAGILHPHDAIDRVRIYEPYACTVLEAKSLDDDQNPGYMSYGPHEESWYDRRTSELIRRYMKPEMKGP